MTDLSLYPLMTKKKNSPEDRYVAAFESLRRSVGAKEPAWIESLRKKAIAHFAERGFPTPREEDWKYTGIEPIAKTDFRFLFESAANSCTLKKIEPFLFDKNWNRLVFINGFYSSELSFLSDLPAGVKAGNLAEALSAHSDCVQEHLGRYATVADHAFRALNTAFIREGAFLQLPKGAVMEEPLHLLFLSSSGDGPPIVQPRNLIVAGEASRATVIETYASLGEGDVYFLNGVTEIVLNAGAVFSHYKIEDESPHAFHVATTQVRQGRASQWTSGSISLGGRLVRNDLNVTLAEEGPTCSLDGLYLVSGGQHIDNHTVIDHTQPRGTSRQNYKGVAGGHGRAVFNGKIFVRRDAQQTDAQQTNKNLQLSEHATVDTKPQLEIFADDVKCAHGAAVGQLDEEAIFYLKSRGMGEENARGLLTYGFASEVIESIKIEALRSQLDRALWDWLKKGERGMEVSQ